MGRIRTKTKRAKVPEEVAQAKGESSQPSIPALLQKAQELVTQCQYDLAQRFAERIIKRAPQNLDARELLGIIQLEKGDVDEAKQVSLHHLFGALESNVT